MMMGVMEYEGGLSGHPRALSGTTAPSIAPLSSICPIVRRHGPLMQTAPPVTPSHQVHRIEMVPPPPDKDETETLERLTTTDIDSLKKSRVFGVEKDLEAMDEQRGSWKQQSEAKAVETRNVRYHTLNT